MYKENSSVMSYLNPKRAEIRRKREPKEILKVIWKWTKIIGFVFILVSMLWGCVQMYQADYGVYQVIDMTGRRVYAPGTGFEIIIRSLGEQGGKHHIVDGNLQEYGFNAISSWGEAFTRTQSPFYGFFVYPIGFILAGILKGFSGTLNPGLDSYSQGVYGVSAFFAIFFTVLIVKVVTLGFTWKSQANQDKMQDLQLKQAEITAKYKNKTDMQSKQRQQMETMALYKKEGLSPMSSIGASFAGMPFLFAIYAIIRSTRSLKIANIGQISLIESPFERMTHGEPVYLALLAAYLPLQIISMLLPTYLQRLKTKKQVLTEAQKKSQKRNLIMQVVMIVVFIFIIASVSSGVAIYWILSSFFQIVQTLSFYFYNQNKNRSGNRERTRRLRQMQNRNLQS